MALAVIGLEALDFEQRRAHHEAASPEIGLAHGRVLADALGRVAGDDLTVDQDGDAVGQAEDDPHVVLDHDQRLAFGHLADEGDRLLGFAVVHPRRRLVEQHDVSAAADRHADFEGPLLGIARARPPAHGGAR